jgi:hypothetical protein
MRTTYLVVLHDDGDMDELASRGSGVGREVIVCGIDVGCVAEVVGVPGERLWSFEGILETPDADARAEAGYCDGDDMGDKDEA